MTCHFQFLDTHCHHELMLKLAENKHCCEGLSNVYTDGSFFGNNSSGLGVYIEEFVSNNVFNKHYYQQQRSGLRKEITCCERNAVLLAIQICSSLNILRINLIVDNHIVFKELLSNKSELYQLIDSHFLLCNIFLVFSHIGIIGNEIADRLANSSKDLSMPNKTYESDRFFSMKPKPLKLGIILRKQSSIVCENNIPDDLKFTFK